VSWLSSKKDKVKTLLEASQRVADPQRRTGRWSDEVDALEATAAQGAKESWGAVEKGFAKLAQLGVGSSLGGIVSPMSALAPMRTPGVAISARKASNVGRFSGRASANSLKPPGPAASKAVVNPNRGVASAMRSGH
jgi:hypothetical protein